MENAGNGNSDSTSIWSCLSHGGGHLTPRHHEETQADICILKEAAQLFLTKNCFVWQIWVTGNTIKCVAAKKAVSLTPDESSTMFKAALTH